jgi:hypothetical protein
MYVEKEEIEYTELPQSFRSVCFWPETGILTQMIHAVYLNGRKLEQHIHVRMDRWYLYFIHASVLRWNQREGDCLIVEMKDFRRYRYDANGAIRQKVEDEWVQVEDGYPRVNPEALS